MTRLNKCPCCGYYGFNGQECFDCGYRPHWRQVLLAVLLTLLALPAMAKGPDPYPSKCPVDLSAARADVIHPDQIEVLDSEPLRVKIIDPPKWLTEDDLLVDGPALDKSGEAACPKDCDDTCEGIGYTPWKHHGNEVVTWKCECGTAATCEGDPINPPISATTEGAYKCGCFVVPGETCPTYALRERRVDPATGQATFRVVPYESTTQGARDEDCR